MDYRLNDADKHSMKIVRIGFFLLYGEGHEGGGSRVSGKNEFYSLTYKKMIILNQ
ncbi:hypothetical protein SANA_27750 [Gottschalkiaceae bacterium SANA]|nr:hypothetical protein SANA_27750 [Gottschalkiaceae bacterium SANA]